VNFPLLGETDDTTSKASASMTSGQRVFETTLSKIIFVGMDNQSSTNDRVWSHKGYKVITD